MTRPLTDLHRPSFSFDISTTDGRTKYSVSSTFYKIEDEEKLFAGVLCPLSRGFLRPPLILHNVKIVYLTVLSEETIRRLSWVRNFDDPYLNQKKNPYTLYLLVFPYLVS